MFYIFCAWFQTQLLIFMGLNAHSLILMTFSVNLWYYIYIISNSYSISYHIKLRTRNTCIAFVHKWHSALAYCFVSFVVSSVLTKGENFWTMLNSPGGDFLNDAKNLPHHKVRRLGGDYLHKRGIGGRLSWRSETLPRRLSDRQEYRPPAISKGETLFRNTGRPDESMNTSTG